MADWGGGGEGGLRSRVTTSTNWTGEGELAWLSTVISCTDWTDWTDWTEAAGEEEPEEIITGELREPDIELGTILAGAGATRAREGEAGRCLAGLAGRCLAGLAGRWMAGLADRCFAGLADRCFAGLAGSCLAGEAGRGCAGGAVMRGLRWEGGRGRDWGAGASLGLRADPPPFPAPPPKRPDPALPLVVRLELLLLPPPGGGPLAWLAAVSSSARHFFTRLLARLATLPGFCRRNSLISLPSLVLCNNPYYHNPSRRLR